MIHFFNVDSKKDKNNQEKIFYIEEDIEVQNLFDELFGFLHDIEDDEWFLDICEETCPLCNKLDES